AWGEESTAGPELPGGSALARSHPVLRVLPGDNGAGLGASHQTGGRASSRGSCTSSRPARQGVPRALEGRCDHGDGADTERRDGRRRARDVTGHPEPGKLDRVAGMGFDLLTCLSRLTEANDLEAFSDPRSLRTPNWSRSFEHSPRHP